jgi:hypothetical protein
LPLIIIEMRARHRCLNAKGASSPHGKLQPPGVARQALPKMLDERRAIRTPTPDDSPDKDPMGHDHYWLTVFRLEEATRGTALWAMRNGYVSMTPLSLDLTNHVELAKLRKQPLDDSRDQPVAAPSRSRKRTPLRNSR